MKKISKKVQSTKLNEGKYSSLNGNTLKKVKGGSTESGSTDHACGTCGATAGLLSN
ncbi:MAG: hypothetical protein HXX16_19250 [Bacteroidales bacterium]|nr:hypothetical protein [Bacteroidales bacterium]